MITTKILDNKVIGIDLREMNAQRIQRLGIEDKMHQSIILERIGWMIKDRDPKGHVLNDNAMSGDEQELEEYIQKIDQPSPEKQESEGNYT